MLCRILAILLAASSALFCANASAIALTDVSFRTGSAPSVFADAAVLVSGNDRTDAVNELSDPFSGDPWTLLDKTDGGSNLFQDVAFTVAGDLNARSGAWRMKWNGPGLPLVADLLLVFKAASDWGAYLFEDFGFTGSDFSGDGTFDISWQNRGGRTPGLSHISVYARLGEPGELPPGGPTSTPAPVGTTPSPVGSTPGPVGSTPAPVGSTPAPVGSADVPVPGSLLLFGLGLTLLARRVR